MPYCTLAEVKRALNASASETQNDALLAELCDDESSRIDLLLGARAPLTRGTWTEDYDGGCDSIVLRHRPAISVASVKDDLSWTFGSSSVIDATAYRLDKTLGILRFVYYVPAGGRQNVRVVYDGGFDPIPGLVRRLAVEMVTARLKQRENPMVVNRGNKDGNFSKTPPEEWDSTIIRRLEPILGVPLG